MEILQRQEHFRSVELRLAFLQQVRSVPRKRLTFKASVGLPLNESVELTTGAVLHNEAELGLGLERIIERDDERVIGSSEYFSFRQHSFHLWQLNSTLCRYTSTR